MNKETAYRQLVKDVAGCTACDGLTVKRKDKEITLTHDPDRREINLWTEWQNSLNAEIILLGQDFGSLQSLQEARDFEKRVDNFSAQTYEKHTAQTDQNLRKLFNEAFGIEIDEWPRDDRLFFTNSIQCYRTGNNNAPCNKKWFSNCNEKYVSRLIDIIRPKVVIVMGRVALEGLISCGTPKDLAGNALEKDYFKIVSQVRNFNNILDDGPFLLTLNSGYTVTVCPVSHTSPPAIRINRVYEKQLADWKKIAAFL